MRERLSLWLVNVPILLGTVLVFYLMYELWEAVIRPDIETGDVFGARSLFGTIVIAPAYAGGLFLHALVARAINARSDLSDRVVSVVVSPLIGIIVWFFAGLAVQTAVFAVGVPAAFTLVMMLPDDRSIEIKRSLGSGLLLIVASLVLALVV
jgi:hypothetical protein